MNKNPKATISAGGPTTFCAGGNVLLTEVAGAGQSYLWYAGASPITGATSISYTAGISGNYKCRVTKNATGCLKYSNVIVVSVTCKEEPTTDGMLSIYPNPAIDVITIETISTSDKVTQITDAVGRILITKNTKEDSFVFDITSLPSGIYFIKVFQDRITRTQEFVKQ